MCASDRLPVDRMQQTQPCNTQNEDKNRKRNNRKRDRKYIDRERVEGNRHQASRSGKEAVADEIQCPDREGRDVGGLVVGVVIASGSSSQDGSLFLLHAIIASALTIRLTLRLEVPG